MASPRLLITCANASYLAVGLKGHDFLSQDCQYIITVDTQNITPLQHGLGQSVQLEFIADDGFSHILSQTLLTIEDKGLIGANTANLMANTAVKRRYQLTIGSRLSLLNSTEHSRIFVDTPLTDVINSILIDAGYHSEQIQYLLATPLPHLPQCVQAMESNKAFFERIIRQYGLFYWFDSSNGESSLVISDNNQSSPYLSRGLLSVFHSAGFNSHLSASETVNKNPDQHFVGFSHCQVQSTQATGLASAISNDYRLNGESLAAHNFALPVSNTHGQASALAQHQSLALNALENVITLTGNVPDIFAGCSFSLNDNSGINASGDYLCIAVEHHCQQPSDETSQDGLSKYHCVVKAIPRGQAFKLLLNDFSPLPMVFSAKIESISANPTLNDKGEYFTKLGFDQTAQAPLTSTTALKKLVNYACANQPQATGWHFPLAHDAQVLIGCVNNDPSQAYIIGFDMNDEQPSVVNSENHFHNRLLSRSGHELRLDDDDIIPTVILQTLGSEHYLELNATTQGAPYIEWLSRLGTINLQAAQDIIMDSEQANVELSIGGGQHIDAKQHVSINAEAETAGTTLAMQSATHYQQTGKDLTFKSKNATTLLTGRSLKTAAQSDVILTSDKGSIAINVPMGATVINADGNISIEGTGSGDITLFNQDGMIKLDSSGNVELIGKDVLTLNGQMITFDGNVKYDIESPKSASEPNAKQPPTIARVADIGLSLDTAISAAEQTIELEYAYQDGEPVKEAPFTVKLADGTEMTGQLDASGKATLENVPTGQFTVQYGEDVRDYEPIEKTTPNPLFGKITPEKAIAMVESGDTSLLDEAGDLAAQAGDWLWGTLQGDFNENPTTSQIVVGTVISMIPVVDQLMDCRDVCANAMLLSDDNEANDTDGWIALTLTGIGFIPVLGSAVKGVGKVIVKNPKESISLAAATLRKLGKGDPIAYIKNIDWQDLGKQGADLIKEKISAIIEALTAITSSRAVRWVVESDTLDSLRKQVKQLNELLPKVDAGIKNAIAVIEGKVKQAIKSYEGELPHVGKTGDVKKVKADELEAPKGNELKGENGRNTHPLLTKMKPFKAPCFKPSKDFSKKHAGNLRAMEHNYARQLKHQENGLNDLSIGEYIENRNRYKDMKRHGTGAAQTDFRDKFSNEITESLENSYLDKFGPIKAKKLAKQRAAEITKNLAALHDPDMIAGGHDKVTRMGNKGVNSSIGPQWSAKPKNGKSRVQLIDEQVEQAFKKYGPDAKLNIQLERCPLNKK